MNVVIDTGVVVAGIFWRNEPRRCLAALARRRFVLYVSRNIVEEYERVAWEVKREQQLEADPTPSLAWIERKAKSIEPDPLPRAVCRDRSDEKFLECAVAAPAMYLISRDKDLLQLKKPFGIRILSPRQFLSILAP